MEDNNKPIKPKEADKPKIKYYDIAKGTKPINRPKK